MDGILLIDKPKSLTSHDVVAKLKRNFDLKKIGHGGTLDPLATGLLIVLIGKATRLAEYIIGDDKTYSVRGVFGEMRNSFDADGEITAKNDKVISHEELAATITSFPKEYDQTPPAFSAKKIAGTAAYKLARAGKTPELKAKKIKIYHLELTAFDFPYFEGQTEVSSGTYIRSLIVDIAKICGTVAYVDKLRRISSGKFHLDQAIQLEEILSLSREEFARQIKPMELALQNLPEIKITNEQREAFIMGKRLQIETVPDTYIVKCNADFLGIGKIDNKEIISRKVFVQ